MDSNPSHANSDWYEELCALACIGELSSSEFDELQRHLATCPDCADVYAEFRRISSQDLGHVAVQLRKKINTEDSSTIADEDGLLGLVLARAEGKHKFTEQPLPAQVSPRLSWFRAIPARSTSWLCRPMVRYGVAALFLCALVGIGTYRFKQAQFSAMLTNLDVHVKDLERRANSSEVEGKEISGRLRREQAEREEAARLLREAQMKYAELQLREKSLDAQLVVLQAQLQNKAQEIEAHQTNSAQREKLLAELETRLSNAVQRTEEQRRLTENLRARLESAEEISKARLAQSQSFTESDAKSLLGARDLHIVDVYDVGSNGETKRSYGRVYYAEKRLLIFYAFDLGIKQGDRSPAGFQAWGYSQPNENKPRNLGLFSLEDASLRRWVLQVKNPRVLEHIDAVFVTLESPNGSLSPKGRRLLYANLAVPPNHP